MSASSVMRRPAKKARLHNSVDPITNVHVRNVAGGGTNFLATAWQPYLQLAHHAATFPPSQQLATLSAALFGGVVDDAGTDDIASLDPMFVVRNTGRLCALKFVGDRLWVRVIGSACLSASRSVDRRLQLIQATEGCSYDETPMWVASRLH